MPLERESPPNTMPTAEQYVPFDRVADIYEVTRYIPAEKLDIAARLLVTHGLLRRGDLFLDAGVGTGRFARHLAGAGLAVTGVDVSEPMLARAALSSRPGVRLVRADLRALPLRSGVFAGGLLVHVLHLIADWKAVLAEARRVLTPGGALFLGRETGKQLRSRQAFHEVAQERGLLRPPLGAPSMDAILGHVIGSGGSVDQIPTERLRWEASVRVGEMATLMRRNVYSHLWHIPPDLYASVADEAERRLRAEFGSLDVTESAATGLLLWRVAWPPTR